MKRIIAALSFFTRLPFWKITKLEKKHYQNLVPLWPMAGWLTGSVMAITFSFFSLIMPNNMAVILAIIMRILLTGALHEDGFADFWDGFGGGNDRQSVLKIMKDSNVGTYGVLALVLYFFLLYNTLSGYFDFASLKYCDASELTQKMGFIDNLKIASIFIVADPFSKWLSSNIINILPYARNENEAKNKLVYNKMHLMDKVMCFIFGVLPAVIFIKPLLLIAFFVASLVAMTMILVFYKKIKGYTGDCCGACFIITELFFYITSFILIYCF